MLELLEENAPEDSTSVIPLDESQTVLCKSIASCLAQGKTPEAISLFLDLPRERVQSLIKSELVISNLKSLAYSEDADVALKNILKGAQFDSVFTLLSLRDSATSETVRYNAATQLINLATKNESEESDDNLPADPVERLAFLETQIKKLS